MFQRLCWPTIPVCVLINWLHYLPPNVYHRRNLVVGYCPRAQDPANFTVGTNTPSVSYATQGAFGRDEGRKRKASSENRSLRKPIMTPAIPCWRLGVAQKPDQDKESENLDVGLLKSDVTCTIFMLRRRTKKLESIAYLKPCQLLV